MAIEVINSDFVSTDLFRDKTTSDRDFFLQFGQIFDWLNERAFMRMLY